MMVFEGGASAASTLHGRCTVLHCKLTAQRLCSQPATGSAACQGVLLGLERGATTIAALWLHDAQGALAAAVP